MELAEVPWPSVRDVDTSLAMLPVGSTEQHGPHAPLGVDFLTATAIAESAAEEYTERTGDDVVVAPTIPVGIAEEHRAFNGTLWVQEETFRSYVSEIIQSLAFHGFHNIVVVNGHGGNVAALRECCSRLTRDDSAYAVAFTWFSAIDADTLGHGGKFETSLIRHLHPDLIRDSELDSAAIDSADTWGKWLHGTELTYDTDEFSANGVVGDPRESSVELGAKLLDEAVDALIDILDEIKAN